MTWLEVKGAAKQIHHTQDFKDNKIEEQKHVKRDVEDSEDSNC